MENLMPQAPNIDGVLIQWGDRLFYPGNRVVKTKPQPKLDAKAARQRAAAIRERIEATVVRRAPQVMVKVTGGGRGMKAIAAHFRYISKSGQLDIEDDRAETICGKESLPELPELADVCPVWLWDVLGESPNRRSGAKVDIALLGLQPGHFGDTGRDYGSLENDFVSGDSARDESVVAHAKLDAPVREFSDRTGEGLTSRVLGAFEQKFDARTVRDDDDLRRRIGIEVVSDVAERTSRLRQPFGQVVDHFDRAICRKSDSEKRDSKQEEQGAKCFHGVFLVGGEYCGFAGFGIALNDSRSTFR